MEQQQRCPSEAVIIVGLLDVAGKDVLVMILIEDMLMSLMIIKD